MVQEDEIQTILNEISEMRKSSNPYLVGYVDHFKFLGQYCLVSEYCVVGYLILNFHLKVKI